jgi:hypothetical protein
MKIYSDRLKKWFGWCPNPLLRVEKKSKELVTLRGVVMESSMKKGIMILVMLLTVSAPMTLALSLFSYVPDSVYDETRDHIKDKDISVFLTFNTQTQERKKFTVLLYMDNENKYPMLVYVVYFKIPEMTSKYHSDNALYSAGQLNRSDSAWVVFMIPEMESNTKGNLSVSLIYPEGHLNLIKTYEVDVFNSLPIPDSAYSLLQFTALGSCTALAATVVTLRFKKESG